MEQRNFRVVGQLSKTNRQRKALIVLGHSQQDCEDRLDTALEEYTVKEIQTFVGFFVEYYDGQGWVRRAPVSEECLTNLLRRKAQEEMLDQLKLDDS